MEKKVIIVAGATASGKSALGLEIAERTDGVIINCDSMQIYKELPIVTAQPQPDEMAGVEHRLYGALFGSTACSVGLWRELAIREIEDVFSQGKQPIILGGTGFYIRALMEGLSKIPDVSKEVRQEATEAYEVLGPEGLVADIAVVSPETAAQLKQNDRQRIIRAWEVYLATGKGLVEWQKENPPEVKEGYSFQSVLLYPERAELYQRCDKRFSMMVHNGAIEEVEALLALGLDPSLPVLRAIGVPEIRSFVEGIVEFDQMVAMAQQSTRRYAKRQLTWLRNQMKFEIKLQNTDQFKNLVL
ncbi:tRNA (adenosine(37)-N6)-dimethylallyltransferase MiaA [Alphaproteobacteria bacterium]|nr:tRNA (adenosine(37)-N6)-dimethylallyltransferase MiaA [Alphaproteobacteria bacterium]